MNININLIFEWIDYELAHGCVTREEVHRGIVRWLREYGYTCKDSELRKYECDYESEHPGVYPELLFQYVKGTDPYEWDTVYFQYSFSKNILYSASYHEIAAGCGFGGGWNGRFAPVTWDRLTAESKGNKGKWEEDAWWRVCVYIDGHPELKCDAFDELRKLRGGV